MLGEEFWDAVGVPVHPSGAEVRTPAVHSNLHEPCLYGHCFVHHRFVHMGIVTLERWQRHLMLWASVREETHMGNKIIWHLWKETLMWVLCTRGTVFWHSSKDICDQLSIKVCPVSMFLNLTLFWILCCLLLWAVITLFCVVYNILSDLYVLIN